MRRFIYTWLSSIAILCIVSITGCNTTTMKDLQLESGGNNSVVDAPVPYVPISARQSPAAAADRRFALVIGNGEYNAMPDQLQPLPNPSNDATDVANALGQLGFNVTLLKDATLNDMDSGIHSFSQQLTNNDVALVYYSGHGMQVNGENFLLPVDAKFEREDQVERQAIKAGALLNKIDRAKTKLVFLDACRNNPYISRGMRGGARGGIAKMTAPDGTLLVYSTDPDNFALDGTGQRNSPFTQSLLRHIGDPGVDIQMMLRNVRAEVKQITEGKQKPWDTSSLEGAFYFAQAEQQVSSPDTELAELQADVDMLMQMPFFATDGGDSALSVFIQKRGPMRITAWRDAAERGHAGAQLLVGLYMGARDKTGLSWIQKSVLQNNPLAQFIMSTAYFGGEFVKQDYGESFNLAYKSAIQGNKYGQYFLGSMYYEGVGAPKNVTEAANWWRKAADQGLKFAEESLAKLEPNNSASTATVDQQASTNTPKTATPTQSSQQSSIYDDEDKDWGVAPQSQLRNSDYHAHTPTVLSGGKVLTTVELASLLEKYGNNIILIDSLPGEHKTIKGAHRLPSAGTGGKFNDAIQKDLARNLALLSGGNLDRPIVVFCASSECWLSYNAALRILKAGYKYVFWYRGGINAWTSAGLSTTDN